jgi:hypothetical protein
MATLPPSRAKRIAVARPIPLPAPVMKAIFPASLGIDLSFRNEKTAGGRRFTMRYRNRRNSRENAMTDTRPFDPALFG